jgi:hypothetical protein
MKAELDKRKLKLLDMRRGGLEIWQYPQPQQRFVIGVDTSSGGPQGDFAVAAVCETVTRALVALWRTKRDPTEWGRMCANLGWYYNTAMLAFETHPSQHGLSACNAARERGYPQLFRRRQEGTITKTITDELGWATTARTKGLMVDKVRVALKEGYSIPSDTLLRELKNGKYAESGLIKFEGRDDAFVAYSIAQKVCDIAVQGGFVSEEGPEPWDWTKEHWKARKKAMEGGSSQGANTGLQVYDGI